MRLIILILSFGLLMGCSQSPKAYEHGHLSHYVVALDGFESRDRLRIEDELMNLGGYSSHRISVTTAHYTEYWYKTSLGSAELDRSIHQLLKQLGLSAVVQFSGRTYTLTSTR